jgi:hypothetical protein
LLAIHPLLTKTPIGFVEDAIRRVLFISAVLCCLTGTSRAQTPATARDHALANAGPGIKNGTDVQAAINAACNGTNPGRVTLPPGVLLVSATVSIPSKCSLLGAGLGPTVLRATNSFAIDIVGPLTIQTTVVGNRTHDNLFDGISDDASLMITVSFNNTTII